MEINRRLLERVAIDNIRDHQIGEIEGGMSWDVARDLGFIPVEEAAQLLPVAPEAPSRPRHLTVAQQNANERRAMATHRRIRGEERRINRIV